MLENGIGSAKWMDEFVGRLGAATMSNASPTPLALTSTGLVDTDWRLLEPQVAFESLQSCGQFDVSLQFSIQSNGSMKSIIFVIVCFLTAPLFAQSSYPPKIADARIETYRKIDSTDLKLWIFGESDPQEPKPAIVFFFGGGWNSGSPEQFEGQARHFGKAWHDRCCCGLSCEVATRREGRRMRERCEGSHRLGARERGATGYRSEQDRGIRGISGRPPCGQYGTISGFGSDERPNAMILFNPVCTLAPIADWQTPRAKAELATERLGVDAKEISPAHHIGPHTPPTLILHGTKDTTVPYASVVAFESVMKKEGRPCKLVGYEGAGHGFFNRGDHYRATLAEADAFLVDLGWLKK